MQLVKDADDYILKFLYKKQIKADIIYTTFLLGTTLISYLTKCSLFLSISLSFALGFSIYWLLREIFSTKEINKHNRAKVRVYYASVLFLYLIMPYSTFIACLIFIIPYSILFVDLVETYSGHDALHWTYIFQFTYGSVLFIIISLIKTFIPESVFDISDSFFMFYRPFALTVMIDNTLGELVDLRTIFKAKAFRDKIVACYDELTEVHNRHGLNQLCNMSNMSAVAMLDLDHFKKVNDTYNHNIGDIVLKEFSKRLSEHNDDNTFICRWGGEEFIILSTSKGDLVDICSKLLIYMRMNPIIFEFNGKSIEHTQTFSCGISDIIENKAIDELVKLADEQAYLAKSNGRNHVYVDNEMII